MTNILTFYKHQINHLDSNSVYQIVIIIKIVTKSSDRGSIKRVGFWTQSKSADNTERTDTRKNENKIPSPAKLC
jgi:hypothetical protein